MFGPSLISNLCVPVKYVFWIVLNLTHSFTVQIDILWKTYVYVICIKLYMSKTPVKPNVNKINYQYQKKKKKKKAVA